MVYNSKTLEVYHNLTFRGKQTYAELLEEKANEILFKHKHPIIYWLKRTIGFITKFDSNWDNSMIPEKYIKKDGFSYGKEENN